MRAVFLQFHAARIVAAILLGRIVAFLALAAGECDHWSNVFLFRSHYLPYLSINLLDDFSNYAGADGQTAFADGEV